MSAEPLTRTDEPETSATAEAATELGAGATCPPQNVRVLVTRP